MERQQINFDGGMQDVPEVKPLNSPDEIVNYEYNQYGEIEKRLDQITFDADLNSVIESTFDLPTGSVLKIAKYPYYPTVLPSDMSSGYDYFLLVYGVNAASSYELKMFYKANRGGTDQWVSTNGTGSDLLFGIYDDGVVFTADSVLRFAYDDNSVYVADGINRTCKITSGDDGEIISSISGIKAPTSIPSIGQIETYDSDYFVESVVAADYADDVGFVQCLYNCETEDGFISNPSPISQTADFQYILLSEETEEPIRWLKKFSVGGLKIPEVNDDIKKKLKYFNIYFRVIQRSEGIDTPAMGFAVRREIFDKDGENTYAIQSPSSKSITPQYDNNLAPVAKDIVAFDKYIIGSVSGNIVDFPFEFDNNWLIKINNINSISPVDGIVNIRLYDKNSSNIKKIDNLDWGDYSISQSILGQKNKLRIFDSDRSTMLPTLYALDLDNHYCDIWIKIPQLIAQHTYSVYFLFGGSGVTDPSLKTHVAGEWLNIKSNSEFSNQVVFQNVRSKSRDCLVASPMEEYPWYDNEVLLNRSNCGSVGWNGSIVLGAAGNSLVDGALQELSMNGLGVGTRSTNWASWEEGITWDQVVDPSGRVMSFSAITKLHTDSIIVGQRIPLLGNYNKKDNKLIGWSLLLVCLHDVVADVDYVEWRLAVSDDENVSDPAIITFESEQNLLEWNSHLIDFPLYINVSIDTVSRRAYLYVSKAGLSAPIFVSGIEKSFVIDGEYRNGTGTDKQQIRIGGNKPFDAGALGGATFSGIPIRVDQFLYLSNTYINNPNVSWNMMNLMPMFDNEVGYGRYSNVASPQYIGSDVIFQDQSGYKLIIVQNLSAFSVLEDTTKIVVDDPTSGNSGTYYVDEVAKSALDVRLKLVYKEPWNTATSTPAGTVTLTPYKSLINNNILFTNTKEDNKKTQNVLAWSKRGGLSFPSSYVKPIGVPIKRIMFSLSTLRLQSQNTVGIFTRNGIYRFIVNGTPDTWAQLSDNLVKEMENFGLLQDEAIVDTPYGTFYLSEAGVVKWSGNNFDIINNTKTDVGEYKIMDIPITSKLYFYYCPLKKQLHITELPDGHLIGEDED